MTTHTTINFIKKRYFDHITSEYLEYIKKNRTHFSLFMSEKITII